MTMNERFMIGVDIGTTSTKAVLYKENGKPVSKHNVEYPLYTPTPATAEQNPEEILLAVVESIRTVIQDESLESRASEICFVQLSNAQLDCS